MFNVNDAEKEIAIGILKKEAAGKKLSFEEVAAKIGMQCDTFDCLVASRGKYYTPNSILFWAQMIADDCTADYLYDQKRQLKKGYPPHDKFYADVWQLISTSFGKNGETSTKQNKD